MESTQSRSGTFREPRKSCVLVLGCRCRARKTPDWDYHEDSSFLGCEDSSYLESEPEPEAVLDVEKKYISEVGEEVEDLKQKMLTQRSST